MKSILVVDDLATDRTILKKILTRHGFSVSEAHSVDDALAKALADTPDLVCMDIVMSDKSGFQGTRDFKKNPKLASIPIVIVSSKNRAPDELNAKLSGAAGYVIKPIDEAALLATLKSLLG